MNLFYNFRFILLHDLILTFWCDLRSLTMMRNMGSHGGILEEQVVGERSKKLQLDRFGRLDPQVSVDRFDQKLSAAASDHSTRA